MAQAEKLTTPPPWQLQYDPGVPVSIDIPDLSLPDLFYRAAAEFPGRPAVIFFGKTISYERLAHLVQQTAAGLSRLGLQAGQSLAIILPNCPQTIITYYAALHLGAMVVMINPLAAPREILEQLQRTGASMAVVLDQLADRVAQVRAELPLRQLIVASLADFLPFPLNLGYLFQAWRQKQRRGARRRLQPVSWRELLSSPPAAVPPRAACSQDIAILQYTGGTTGVPKAAVLTHRNLVSNVLQINAWLQHCRRGQERILAVLPYFHVFGMTAGMNWPLNLGGAIILLPKFDATQVLKTIHRQRPTVFPAVPTIFIALLHHPDLRRYRLTSLWGCISGSAPLPREVQARFEALTNGRIIEGYGLTETAPVTHLNPIARGGRPGSIGLPFPNTECRIVDAETGCHDVSVGEVGELILRGPQVMSGYWQNPAETALAIRDGWFYTGDLARMDAEGYFYIVDRKKDLIIASGFNIFPREVEEVIHQHPAVQEVVVFGVPEAYRGETVMAVIVPKAGAALDAEEISHFCRERLAAYKVPAIIEFRPALPKTLVGKVLRRQLRQEVVARRCEASG
uniref:long-chain-fatty-acid--CoA ligase n=1 Tax=Desulfobacca sp. TaxID=2067990 RepID=UPI004049E1BB